MQSFPVTQFVFPVVEINCRFFLLFSPVEGEVFKDSFDVILFYILYPSQSIIASAVDRCC